VYLRRVHVAVELSVIRHRTNAGRCGRLRAIGPDE